jgi:hypothetical protein
MPGGSCRRCERGRAPGAGSAGSCQALAWPSVGVCHGLDDSDSGGDKVVNKEREWRRGGINVTDVTVGIKSHIFQLPINLLILNQKI